MDPETEERVRQRAYEIWQLQGCPNGREQEHWNQAVQEICQDGGTSEIGAASDRDLHSDPGNTTPQGKPSEDPRSPRRKPQYDSGP
jgi:hypothetical protein